MNSCGSPSSTESLSPGDLFKELWSKLKECHDKELQELLLKINKLKKQRCLDAQRLEEFYTKNQQLREQQKVLHDTIKVLEDRLRAGLCDRCAVTEEHMRKKQQEFENIRQQNLKLITELMNEKNSLQDENKRLSEQLHHVQTKTNQKTNEDMLEDPGECDDGVIPDSPVGSFPLTMMSRMRRRRENRHVRYAEKPQEGTTSSESVSRNTKREDILVPETCDLQLSPPADNEDVGEKPVFNLAAVVAETIGLDVHEESQSQSVLSLARNNAAIASLPHRSEESPLRQIELELTEKSQSSHELEWGTQQASPVFGVAAGNTESRADMDTSSSMVPLMLKGVLKSQYPKNTADALVHKMQAKSDDVTMVVPLCLGTETESLIGECSGSREISLKQSPNESGISVINKNGASTKYNFDSELYKQTGSRVGKRKKGELDEEVSCENSFNKENDIPPKSGSSPKESLLDKPLDLSDRFSGIKPQERSQDRSRNRANPSLSLGTLKPYPKKVLQRDLREDPQQQAGQKKAVALSKGAQYVDSMHEDEKAEDDSQLFEDLEIGNSHEPRRKARSVLRGCEPASVLQPNPHMVPSRSLSMHSEHNKSPVGNFQWSIDPGADLSQYEMDMTLVDAKGESPAKPDLEDLDYTYVNDSVLLKMKKKELMDSESPEESKGNDSFADMFDKTEYGEYVSCLHENSSSQRLSSEEEDEEPVTEKRTNTGKGEVYQKQKAFVEPYFQSAERKKPAVDFPHIEVVRNKEERRKMLGHTCKECEIYYADLPEEERAKKLASCSRHRFRYIPPSTPENFWEVGFPSTQTCKDRGYIKEEGTPCQRPRRRQPYNAMFSPKVKEQKI
ncbi:DNA endonuclease RBBP8 [Rhinophrynus dorsalis]